jgi:hypothetical protein
MDLDLMELIQSLHREKEMLDRAIASLEELRISRSRPQSSGRRGGPKSMSAEERKRVSSRIERYWAARE